jgi:hypothetical protein
LNTSRRIAAAVVATAAVLLASGGCTAKAREPYKDAPVADRNKAPADVITFPDGFSNVSAKCDGPNRVYVVFHGDSRYGTVAVAPNDPRCTRAR